MGSNFCSCHKQNLGCGVLNKSPEVIELVNEKHHFHQVLLTLQLITIIIKTVAPPESNNWALTLCIALRALILLIS